MGMEHRMWANLVMLLSSLRFMVADASPGGQMERDGYPGGPEIAEAAARLQALLDAIVDEEKRRVMEEGRRRDREIMKEWD
jgi:hypothetical protein